MRSQSLVLRLQYVTNFYCFAVNEVLGDHNVDKQMTDSRGEVCILKSFLPKVFTR